MMRLVAVGEHTANHCAGARRGIGGPLRTHSIAVALEGSGDVGTGQAEVEDRWIVHPAVVWVRSASWSVLSCKRALVCPGRDSPSDEQYIERRLEGAGALGARASWLLGAQAHLAKASLHARRERHNNAEHRNEHCGEAKHQRAAAAAETEHAAPLDLWICGPY